MNYLTCTCKKKYWCCKYVLQMFKDAKEKGLTLYGNGIIVFKCPCGDECRVSQDRINQMLGVKDEKPVTYKYGWTSRGSLFDKDDHDIDWGGEMDYYDGY